LKITSPTQTNSDLYKKALKPYEEIAEGMEANFTNHLLQEMKKTIPKDNPDSAPMDYYNSLMDSERSQLMAKSETGLGIKKIILDQIVPHHLKNKVNHPSNVFKPNALTKENSYE